MSHDCKTYEYKCNEHHRPVFVTVTVPVGGEVEFIAPDGLVTCPYCHAQMSPEGVGDSRGKLATDKANTRQRTKLHVKDSPGSFKSTPESRTCLRLFTQELRKGDESLYEPAIVKCIQSLVADAGFTIHEAALRTWHEEPATVNRVLDRIDTRYPITSPELRTLHDELRSKGRP